MQDASCGGHPLHIARANDAALTCGIFVRYFALIKVEAVNFEHPDVAREKNIDRIRQIPGWIVQGRFDVVTPMDAAWRLKTSWPGARFEVVWDAGHASTEPGIVDALVRATDQALRV